MPITKGHTMANDTISPETQHKMAMLERQHEANEKRQQLVEAFSSFVNGASQDEIKEFATDISHDHRTLVQAKFGLFLQFAKVLASNYDSGNYDLRNEYACKVSKDIMNQVNGISAVPFI